VAQWNQIMNVTALSQTMIVATQPGMTV